MKNNFKYLIILILSFFITSCSEKWLEKPESTTTLLPDQVWNDVYMINSILANYYSRLPTHTQINSRSSANNYSAYDECMAAGSGSNIDGPSLSLNNLTNYEQSRWSLWNYDLIRDINLAIEGIDKYSTKLSLETKKQFKAEFRFLRAYNYFELVKRMGGVPIITTQLIYDFSGDPSYLRQPRNTEAEVYDFIASELDAIKDDIGNVGSINEANKYTVLALKCRAMLYAGSIAKYNNLLALPINTPGGEVGIPASRANGYYQAALDAAKEIITSKKYSLYQNTTDLGRNFYEAIITKANNPEMILVTDINVSNRHEFAYFNIIRSAREGGMGGSGHSPSLNLVEAYEYLDGSSGILKGVGTGSNTAEGQSDWIFYDNISDIFANKDARLYGTIIYPGTTFRDIDVSMQAGVYVWNATANKYDRFESSNFGQKWDDGKLQTGYSGPMRGSLDVSVTGFYIRKFMDESPLASTSGVLSTTWWVRFRYAEVLLNAAEAAFELGGENITDALTYINQVRQRAGFPPNSLNETTLTFDKIMNERRVELAFEDHRVWDLARWRQAHLVWNGSSSSQTAMLYALYPYRIINPSDPSKDGKYVFDKFVAPKFIAPRFYQMRNYYSSIPQNVLDNNPLIVENPFQ